MPSELSLAAIVERLEAQIEFHREREAFHAEQEAHHREQRAVHAAELETLTSNLTAFKAAATTAVELARREIALASSPGPPVPDQDIGRKPSLTKMVTRILETKAPSDVFGTAAITQEVNQHYGKRLHRPVKAPNGTQAMLVVKDTRFPNDRVEFTDHTLCSVDDFVLWASKASEVLDRFAGHLVTRYILGLYDLDCEVVAPRYDLNGSPVITNDGFQIRRISIRQLFVEGGVHV